MKKKKGANPSIDALNALWLKWISTDFMYQSLFTGLGEKCKCSCGCMR